MNAKGKGEAEDNQIRLTQLARFHPAKASSSPTALMSRIIAWHFRLY